MSGELVKRLRGTPLYEGSGEDSDLGEEAAARISALEAALESERGKAVRLEFNLGVMAARSEATEAKLVKALGALRDIGDGEPEWPDDPQKELDWCRNRALTACRQARDATR